MKVFTRSLCFVLATLLMAPAIAGTITVANLNDTGPGSLRQAVADASPGDTINFGINGEIVLASGTIVLNKNLTIQGSGTNLTILKGNRFLVSPASRVLRVASGVVVSISDVTITQGGLPGGEPLANGAGVLNQGTLTLTRCDIDNNSTEDGSGGGIANQLTATLTMDQCVIRRNFGQGPGGFANFGTATLNNTIITANKRSNMDTGGFANYGSLLVNGCLIASNEGRAIENYGTARFLNTTITSHSTDSGGGGAVRNFSGGVVKMSFCTITHNSATRYGGAFRNEGTFTLKNTIVALNTSLTPFEPDYPPNVYGNYISAGYNLIGEVDGGTIAPTTGDQFGTVASPIDPLLGSLQQNGGYTATRGLLSGSPAVDAGSSTDIDGNTIVIDQRSYARPEGAAHDIGAFELGPTPPPDPNIVTNGNDSGAGSLRQVILNAAPGDTVQFDPDLIDPILLTSGPISIGKNLTIAGLSVVQTIVDAQGASRLFIIEPGANVTINHVTLRGGYVPSNAPGDRAGGGIRNSGNLTLNQCLIKENVTVSGKGGAIANVSTPGFGSATLALNNCVLISNSAVHGGGLFNALNAQATVTVTALIANIGGLGGTGGIQNEGTLEVQRSTFSGTGGQERAIKNTGTLNIQNSTITGHYANTGERGGGIYNTGTANIDHCTITKNYGYWSGGGIKNSSPGIVRMKNTILAGNGVAVGAADEGPDIIGPLTSFGYNLIRIGKGGSITATTGDQIGTMKMPIEPWLGPLQDNGGPTLTIMPTSGSPARNSGSFIDLNGNTVVIDQRGAARNTHTGISEIGAVEVD